MTAAVMVALETQRPSSAPSSRWRHRGGVGLTQLVGVSGLSSRTFAKRSNTHFVHSFQLFVKGKQSAETGLDTFW